ncbi:Oxidoreductase molybdopterin binding domain-containing protein [Lentzea albidocapillata subsp. violacea]|uniref:Oxidoreductase molybdopterin binding domain-containing protein n=1 Tax=Lentzea albidocapillata subsp. violacea TaxID=128104 RepID=A0A1G9K9N4_9PSEU|nr:molybdopterin-dependent oxidoreductase [Lentzea albidocapillata]SDL46339.1 Oxidoreductase molybdopterin binding domain-containing protein [Lentzea albidocapillata subsp. violacea]
MRTHPPGQKTLPPGQRRVDGFPRFGTHLHQPAPPVPDDPVITISGAVLAPSEVRLADLSALPRSEIVADFHCVAGWTATGLRWEGVRFADFYRRFVEPALEPGITVTHLVFEGLDGAASVVELRDALADDVLLAQRLNGHPLDSDHGAPIRLVSPAQYGHVSTKHLCMIEVCSALPTHRLGTRVLDRLLEGHPRARVEHEERHGRIAGRLVRPFYRALIRPIRYLSAKGAQSR